MNANILIPLIIALVMGGVITVASGFPYLQAKLSILVAGGFVLLLALVELGREFRVKATRTIEAAADAGHSHQGARVKHVVEAVWMVGFALSIYLFGFMIALPVYMCAYMKSHGTTWLVSIITGVLSAGFCYGLFTLLLDLVLYPGVFFIPHV